MPGRPEEAGDNVVRLSVGTPHKKHRIPITEETIALGNRMVIGMHDAIMAGKGRHQHQ